MGNVYPLDAEKSLILYESGNTLYIRTAMGGGITRPVALCTDFAGGLSDAVHNDTLYYCYFDTNHDIVVRSVTDLQTLCRIEDRGGCGCLNPCLVSFQDALLLFYVMKNPVNGTYNLQVIFPFDGQRRVLLPEKNFRDCPEVAVTRTQDVLLVCADDGASQLVLSFAGGMEYAVLENAAVSGETISRCRRLLSDCETRLGVVRAEKAALADKLAALEEDNVRANRLVAERDAVIESIKRQYAQLMDTALKYREEAAKWHEIARRQAPPLPGERLITDDW